MSRSVRETSDKWAGRTLGPFTVVKVATCNHKPDVFCVGRKHVAHASDHCGGMLGEESLRAHPCAHCGEDYDAHSYDTVMFLQLTRNASEAEATAALKPVCDEATADGIDGFAFVETPEKFRVGG